MVLPDGVHEILPGIYRLRASPLIHVHLIVDSSGRSVLIDTGLLPIEEKLRRLYSAIGARLENLSDILLTHGHLDHTANARHLAAVSGARIHAPLADRIHINQDYEYRGIARACGLMEAVGRRLVNYQAPKVTRWFSGDEMLDVWEDLQAIALPGHTAGHSGFYSRKHNLLFSGDLFSYFERPRQPPIIYSIDRREIDRSILKAAALKASHVSANHSYINDSMRVAAGLQRLARRIERRRGRNSGAF